MYDDQYSIAVDVTGIVSFDASGVMIGDFEVEDLRKLKRFDLIMRAFAEEHGLDPSKMQRYFDDANKHAGHATLSKWSDYGESCLAEKAGGTLVSFLALRAWFDRLPEDVRHRALQKRWLPPELRAVVAADESLRKAGLPPARLPVEHRIPRAPRPQPVKIAIRVLERLTVEHGDWIESDVWRDAYAAERKTGEVNFYRMKVSFRSVEGHARRKGMIRTEGSLVRLILANVAIASEAIR